jgi:hypothetical protein
VARVRVTSTLGDLAADLDRIAAKAKPELSKVVARNVTQGNKVAQGIARRASGKHGKNYWKRLTSELTGPLSGEFGPHDGGTPVGAGYRHGRNTDMAKAADIIGPRFAKDVSKTVDGWFW